MTDDMPRDRPDRARWRRLLASPRAGYAIDALLLLSLCAAFCGPYLLPLLRAPIPGGWDGVPHYGVAHVYARHIFPALHGWMPEYFTGMPFPDFYPPAFYFLVAALAALGLSTATAFLALQTATMASVPLLTYLCGRRLTGARAGGLVAGALAVGFLMDRTPLTRFGIAVEGTFETGLSTQLLGHCFLLAFCHALLGAHDTDRAGRRAAARAALFFGLVPLTNVNTVWIAALLFLCVAVARILGAPTGPERRRMLGLHLAMGSAAVLLSACWVLPMLAHLGYVPTLATEPMPPGAVVFTFLRLGGYLLLALIAALALRDGRALALVACALVLAVVGVIPVRDYPVLRDLPLQPGRHAVVFPFLMTVLVGYVVVAAARIFPWQRARALLGALCVAVFFCHLHPAGAPATLVSDADMANYRQVIAAMDGRTDGRVLAQVGEHGYSDGFAMQSLLGAAGLHSLTTVFRESAVNVFLAVPLRNSIAGQGEAFGIDHKLDPASLAQGSLAQQLARLRLFNVKYLVAQTDEMKQRIAVLPGIRRISPPGRWELYTFDTPGFAHAQVPARAPVLAFAALTVKRRPEVGFDFMRLGEEMFAAGRLDVPLVLSRANTLDGEQDWERFHTALITQYVYEDRARAYAAIERFSRDRHLIVLESDDPLDAEVARLAVERPTIHRIPRPDEAEIADMARALLGERGGAITAQRRQDAWKQARRLAVSQACARIFDIIEAVSVPLDDMPAVAHAQLERDTARIELDRAPAAPVPVWVRQGYFPSWKNPDGEPIYMATPAFQLTFLRQRTTTLRSESGAVHWLGGALGVLGLVMISWLGTASMRRAGHSLVKLLRRGHPRPAAIGDATRDVI